MATLATTFRSTSPFVAGERVRSAQAARVKSDPFRLRALPYDDVYFYSKRIDNSRVVRLANPKAKSECWSAIAVFCLFALLAGSVMAPTLGGILAGYKLQSLQQERQQLLDERRSLELDEAALLSPARLDQLAKKQQLVQPEAGQVIHLQPSGENSVAMSGASEARP